MGGFRRRSDGLKRDGWLEEGWVASERDGWLAKGKGVLKRDGSRVASEEGCESRIGDSVWVAWKRDWWLSKTVGWLEKGWVA
jgi:hypothetical protein